MRNRTWRPLSTSTTSPAVIVPVTRVSTIDMAATVGPSAVPDVAVLKVPM